jgi:hypothetical protein
MSIFTDVLLKTPKRSVFDLSHDHKTSLALGDIVPTFCEETLPGDSWFIKPEVMLRFQPLLAPIVHKVQVAYDFFYVPYRLLWPEWEKWITGESTAEHPYIRIEVTLTQTNQLAFYLGYPKTGSSVLEVSPFAIAAYDLIWDEWYRDQNLQTEIFVELVAGNNSVPYVNAGTRTPQKRAWMHDYFTSALPTAQFGAEVTLPLVSQAVDVTSKDVTTPNIAIDTTTSNPSTGANVGTDATTGALENTSTGNDIHIDPNGAWEVDINAGATNITTLRRAFRLQEWLERAMRVGRRYREHLLGFWNVRSSDKTIQVPRFLGRFSQTMRISEVLSTAFTDQPLLDVPVGYQAGHGMAVMTGPAIKYYCEEHGVIIGNLSVVPKTAYWQGLPKKFHVRDLYDYGFPQFAQIGEQPIYNKELLADSSISGVLAARDEVFGYIPRYAEYKYSNDRVSGDMTKSLKYWHFGIEFDALPTLSEDFITATPSNRVFAVTGADAQNIIGYTFHKVMVKRSLPYHGIPSI